MRSFLVVLLVSFLVAPTLLQAEEEAPAPVRVWKGYLWKDGDGRIQIGWPVVAMGVMEQPDHVVEFPDRESLAPLVSAVEDSYVFWNYTLEKPIAEALAHLPRVLVQVKGPVLVAPGDGRRLFSGGGARTMKPAKLVSVEFVDPEWLDHWATVFREPASPWRIRETPPGDPVAQTRALAPKVLAAVRNMRAVPGPPDAQKAIVRKIDAEAKVTTAFRRQTEHAIVRWLLDVDEKHAIGLEGLDALGPILPTTLEVQRFFLASETKAAFLERVKRAWAGALDEVTLTHYEMDGDSTVWTQITLDVVAEWDDDTYAARRETTRKMVGG